MNRSISILKYYFLKFTQKNFLFLQFVNKNKKMERQQYLQFFLNNKKKPSSKTIYQINKVDKQSRSLHSHGQKHDKKLLPHISQQYQYKITNQLLVQKIMNPKRDKLITQNFPKSVSRPSTKHFRTKNDHSNSSFQNKVKSLIRDKNKKQKTQQIGNLTLQQKIRIKKNLSRLRQKGMKSYERQFNLALQNDRMGRRIVNTKSSVQQILKKTFYTYKSNSKSKQANKQNNESDYLKCSFIKGQQNKKYYFSGKINNGVKVFFNPIKNDSRSQSKSLHKSRSFSQSHIKQAQLQHSKNISQLNQQKFAQLNSNSQILRVKDINSRQIKTSGNLRNRLMQNLNYRDQIQDEKHLQTHHPQSFKIFGKGPTILMVYNLQIQCNPAFKQDSLLILQLITYEKRINFRKNKQKSIRTVPICYDFFKLKQQDQITNCIRFGINVSQIGDFVPLRIYRVHGVEIQELGIIDIDLAAFRYRKSQLLQNNNSLISKQYKQNIYGQRFQRQIISGVSEGQLRKNLLNKPVEISVKLNYKIYSKRFKSVVQPVS